MNQFFHITISYTSFIKNSLAIDGALTDPTGDWLRYNESSWIVWTNKTPMELSEIINRYLVPTDQYLILKLEKGVAYGRLPQWVWDWINRPRV